MDKVTKTIIAIAVIAGLGLLILDGQMGKADCEDSGYNQTTGECREEW